MESQCSVSWHSSLFRVGKSLKLYFHVGIEPRASPFGRHWTPELHASPWGCGKTVLAGILRGHFSSFLRGGVWS